MKYTPNLNLPVYNDPDNDVFDMQEWNGANESIDGAYKQIMFFKEELPKTNATAEVIEARKGEPTLAKKIEKIDKKNIEFDTQLEEINQQKAEKSIVNNIQGQIDNLVIDGTGDGNPEVVQARGTKDLLRQNIDNKIEKKFINLFNKNTITIGFQDNTIGAVYPKSDGREEFFFSELINVKDYDVLYPYSNWSGTNPCYIYKIVNGKVASYTSKINEPIDVSSYDYLVIGGRNVDLNTTMLATEITNKYINFDEYRLSDYVLNKTVKNEKANIIDISNMIDGFEFATSGVYPYLSRSDMRISSLHKLKQNYLACLNNNTEGSIYIKIIKSDMLTYKIETIAPKSSMVIDCSGYSYFIYETLLTTNLENITLTYSDTVPIRTITKEEKTIGEVKEINDLKYIVGMSIDYINKMMLKGINIVFDGDSITAGAGVAEPITGIAPNNNKGWGYSIQQLCPQSICYGYGQSGWRIGRIQGESSSTSLLDHIPNYPSNVDVFVLSGGYNDLAQQVAIGEIQKGFYNATFDEYTTIGALENWIKQIRVKYPLAQILYVITGTRTFSDSENTLPKTTDSKGQTITSLYSNNNEKFNFYMNNIEKVLNKWGIPYIDMRKNSGIVGTGADEKEVPINAQMWENSMGLHPTKVNYDTHIAPKILNKIRSVI